MKLITLIAAVFFGGLLGFGLGGSPPAPEVGAYPETLLLGRIHELQELVVLRIPVSRVQASRVTGYTGAVGCVLLVNGEIEISTDLSQARFENINTENKTATLILPEPSVHRVRLDHERTSVFTVQRDGLWQLVPSDEPTRRLVNQAMAKAQRSLNEVGE